MYLFFLKKEVDFHKLDELTYSSSQWAFPSAEFAEAAFVISALIFYIPHYISKYLHSFINLVSKAFSQQK